MNHEFTQLSPEHQAAVRRVVRLARAQPGDQRESLPGGGEAYAYRGGRGVHWGFNRASDGYCDKRGTWPAGEPA